MTAIIITPPRTTTRTRGEVQVQVTEWTCGAYTLQKVEANEYTDWRVSRADRDLPAIEDSARFGEDTEWGVNWSACGSNSPAEATAYAQQIMAAAATAEAFNAIMAAETN